MSDSSPSDAARRLGVLLTATEAREVADRLADGDSLTAALRAVAAGNRVEVRAALIAAVGTDLDVAVGLLRAVEGARSVVTTTEPMWTMPGAMAGGGPLHSSVARLVAGARRSITCSTFNFQRSSGLWSALAAAAQRPDVAVRVYVDTKAAAGPGTPTVAEVAAHVHPGVVLRTSTFDGAPVRNHAKFLAIDHRFLLVTSANFSWSAEFRNVELGVLLDDPNLTDAVETQLRSVEQNLYVALSTPR
jgi:PLD-like domain